MGHQQNAYKKRVISGVKPKSEFHALLALVRHLNIFPFSKANQN